MDHPSLLRRFLLSVCVTLSLIAVHLPVQANMKPTLQKQFAELEAKANGRLGISFIDTATGCEITYRGNERFPFCSTFKVLVVGAILQQSMAQPGLLLQNVLYSKADLVTYSPLTEKRLAQGMTITELCAATLQYSDNTAANLLMRQLGGLQGVNRFARSIGDASFRLDRWETALNSALPGDERDTTTPSAMAASLKKLVLGDVLAAPQRERLIGWMKANTTGNASIRAGVPAGWIVGDKTGSGGYGTTNDIAVLWPQKGAPLVLAVYFTQHQPDADPRRDIIAEATRLLMAACAP